MRHAIPYRMKTEKVILNSLKSLANFNFKLYSKVKSNAKAKAEITLIGENKVDKVEYQLFKFNEQEYHWIDTTPDLTVLTNPANQPYVLWLNFHGIHEVAIFEQLARLIDLDRYTLRQIVDTTLRPKVDEYGHYLFFSVKSVTTHEEGLFIEQVSFILGTNYVISFQEESGDHFDHIRNKIRENLGMIRKRGSDYLLAQLLDAMLDNYVETIDVINQEISLLEQVTLNHPKPDVLIKLEKTKKSTEIIKKSLKPLKEALLTILNDRMTFISKENKKYFRDLKNSCANAIEEADASLKALESITNIYFASLTHRMNEIMKVLTTVATIFIPLTFIVG